MSDLADAKELAGLIADELNAEEVAFFICTDGAGRRISICFTRKTGRLSFRVDDEDRGAEELAGKVVMAILSRGRTA